MNILIVGGGHEVSFLADALIHRKHRVAFVNSDPDLCGKWLERYPKSTVIHGDGTKPDVLRQAALERIDLLLALFESDAENYVICGLAKRVLHIPKTLAYTSNPINAEALLQLGVDLVVDKVDALATSVDWVVFAN